MQSFKNFVGLDSPEEKTFGQEFDEHISLSRKTRLILFAVTFIAGWLVSLLALLALPQIISHPEKFAILYTVGNIISLSSTMFLWGPCKQLKDMFKPIRAGATIVYLISMGTTLFFAFKLQILPLVLVSMLVQFCAMIWYSASYIPYGRAMIQKCVGSVCSSCLA
jgi:hypothetical protein